VPTARARPLGAPFRRLWTASIASNVGDGVLVAAMPLLARSATDNPLGVAAVTVAATAPWLIFGLFAGVVVDRVDRRRLLVNVDLVRAAVLAAAVVVVASGGLSLAVLAVVALVLGFGETLFDTASQAFLPSVVEADQLETANGRLFGGQIAANSFAGPALGGLLVAVAAEAPLALDAVTFAVSALLLAKLPPGSAGGRSARPPARISHDLREGLAWLWRHRTVRALAIGAGLVNLAHTGALAVLVLLVRDELGGTATGYGMVIAVAAAGGVIGTQVSAVAVRRLGRRGALLSSVGAFSVGLATVSVAPSLVVVVVGLALFGLGGEIWNVVAVSYRQAKVPDALLGRVMATYRFIAYGAMPVGAAVGGALAVLDVRAPFAFGALLTGLLAVHLATISASDPELA
jgi:MFS family permease